MDAKSIKRAIIVEIAEQDHRYGKEQHRKALLRAIALRNDGKLEEETMLDVLVELGNVSADRQALEARDEKLPAEKRIMTAIGKKERSAATWAKVDELLA